LELCPPAGPVIFVASGSLPEATRTGLVEAWRGGSREVFTVLKPPGEPESVEVDRLAADLRRQLRRWEADSRRQGASDSGSGRQPPTGFRAVIGLGGGSVMDLAKGLAILVGTEGSITDYEFGQKPMADPLPLYLAPTTCGSGSEVTPYAVFINSDSRRKFTLTHPGLRARVASVDPGLLESLPPGPRLATSLDAFTHCLEALLNRSGPGLAVPAAEAGLKIAWKEIHAEPRPGNSDDDLAMLSLLGGAAIAHSRTGLIHTLSVAFSALTDLPHGILNTHLLPFALSHNLPGYRGRLAQVVSGMTGQSPSTDEAALESLAAWTRNLVGAELPFPARDVRNQEDRLVERLLQDSGLPAVSHGEIAPLSLRSLVRRIADAA
jgi:alcohol dehydrogenase class IV